MSQPSIIHLLLQAGANPALTNSDGKTPLDYLRLIHHAAIALLEQYPEAQKDVEKASLLVKARRLVVLSRSTVTPSYLQGRVAQGRRLPRVQLTWAMPPRRSASGQNNTLEEDRKLRTLLAFLFGVEGGWENAGMPCDVLRVVLDLLMPSWDPL